jgi:hypothetical protein
MMFLQAFAFKSCFVDVSDAVLAVVYEITLGNVRKVLCTSRKRAANTDAKAGRPPTLTEAQEDEIIQLILTDATQGKFMKKGELLDLVEKLYGKILTYG